MINERKFAGLPAELVRRTSLVRLLHVLSSDLYLKILSKLHKAGLVSIHSLLGLSMLVC